ncbi:MAG: M48 family metallopeptidase [Aquabacterium sp.]|uniref:M48 family metallopeptidase n=1 Tax=Aquabacterium sp. TaxID=1872578 RepID=UPI001216B5D2|nr:M48 family metallopeptidase [Aquabacterium sp.]TAK93044.1 MAG: M48 family metallopeptidase [Aquabacterium sp.]
MSATDMPLLVDYFDGLSARAHRVSMRLHQDMLQLTGPDLFRQIAINKVQWSERTRHGIRNAHFMDGGSIQSLDNGHWDDWLKAHHLGETMVVRAQQSWRWTALATGVLLLVAVLGYWWGLPMAARALTPLIPAAVDQEIGQRTLQAMDEQWLHPSQLGEPVQAHWRQKFDLAAQQGSPRQTVAVTPSQAGIRLHFRHATIGPNAFALPDGSIVVTDELIALLQDREDVILGILGHELGHVQLRHGLRTLIQTGLLGVISSAAFGDFSTWLAGAPALLGHLAYSRNLEREADDVAIAFMHRNHIKPSVMVVFFQRLKAKHPSGQDLGIAFSSHPADAERIARFKAADLDDPAAP